MIKKYTKIKIEQIINSYLNNIKQNSNNLLSINDKSKFSKDYYFENIPSLLLLFSALEKYTDDNIITQLETEYFKRLIKSLNNVKKLSLSLCYGITGINYAVQSLSISTKENVEAFNKIFCRLLDIYIPVIDKKKDVASKDYDTINGLTSVLNYLLLFYNDINLINKTISILIKKVKQIGFTNGTNISISHGITGPLVVLSKTLALDKNKYRNEIKELEKEYILKVKNYYELINEKNFVGISSDLFKKIKTPERMSWCYGTPGIARAIFEISKNIGSVDTKWIKNIFENIYYITKQNNKLNLVSPTICHGYSGLLLILNSMFIDTQSAKIDQFRNEIIDSIISLYNKDYAFGFYEYDYVYRGQKYTHMRKFKDLGILNGASGVILSLLSTIDPSTTKLDKILLIS